MNTLKKILSAQVLVLVAVATFSSQARAALTPTFVLALANNNTQVQVTVLGADANASATLYYPVNAGYQSLVIGTTNSSGYLSSIVTPSTYNITAGGASYVMVDGVQSQTQIWPAYSAASQVGSSGLYLSQNNVTVVQGQSVAISASANTGSVGTVAVPANTNPSVASASVSGTQVIVNGIVPGSSTMTVCATNAGCATLFVTVQQISSSSNTSGTGAVSSSAVSFSPSSITLQIGQNQTVSLSGPGSYYISSHSNAGIVSTSINGSVLTVGGMVAGTDNMGVCGTSANTTSCSTLTVIVSPTTSANQSTQGTISFSQNQANLSIGQTQVISVTGSGLGSYYLSNNSNSASVSANISGNSISLTGIAAGGSNITVCQLAGACGNVYGYVSVGASASVPAGSITARPLALSSVSVTSNNVNDTFMGAGAALTFSFTMNQPISTPSVTVGGRTVPAYGSGSGPYTAIYTMIGNEPSPLAADISYTGIGGGSGSNHISLGASSVQAVPPGFSSAGAVFTSYLRVGSTGAEVTALQRALTAAGVYSGPITGTFGGQTEAGVRRYQAAHGLDQLGVVGPGTRAALNSGN